MNTEDIRLATKAQAGAVRAYLESIGVSISHTQALEVIARGEGMRSRHLLATPRAPQPLPVRLQEVHGYFTRIGYRYVDGSNCKRSSGLVFRGRLLPEQLRFIASRLEENEYFVPCQVGFESLHLAFTDDGGVDHYWHSLQVGDPEYWVLDADGYVLEAGDARQVPAAQAQEFATDADCSNLVWRFGRVLKWDAALQGLVVSHNAYERPVDWNASVTDEDALRLAATWRQSGAFPEVSDSLLTRIAFRLLEEGFIGADTEMRRPVGPSAYQFCIVQPCAANPKSVELNFDISTFSGSYLTHTPVAAICSRQATLELGSALNIMAAQLQASRSMPEVYDAAFE